MGNQAITTIRYDGARHQAKVLLETEEVIVRGALKLRLAFRDIGEAKPEGDDLILRWPGHELRIALGRDAAKWAEKIRNPKSRIEKLGVKAGQKVSAIGGFDGDFADELAATGAVVSPRLHKARDVIFVAVNSAGELSAFAKWRKCLQPAGAVWVIRPKSDPRISEEEVMRAGKAAGLVDVKVVRFSPTHTAEKFVIPLTSR